MSSSGGRPPGWTGLADDIFGARYWDLFETTFRFRASTTPDRWPAINEPKPSATIDLTPIFEAAPSAFAAGEQAVNALALLSMVEVFSEDEQLVALDWQHPTYLLHPHEFARAKEPFAGVQPFPNGDYYAFLNASMSEGLFGHPWEQSLCIIGPAMVASLEPRLSWLPLLRRDGFAIGT